jgi:pimeloyl-ACP methyl ester carboxylesterase
MQVLTSESANKLDAMARTTRGCFYSGTAENPVYADHIPARPTVTAKAPIVMLHGAFHTGAAYLTTPDGREGWAPYFASRGHDVYVVDWPGHGRSPSNENFSTLSTEKIARSIAVLVDEIGPAIILAHSAGGPLAWWIADNFPAKVAAIVGIAPGPPANIQKSLPEDPASIEALRFDQSVGCPVYSRLDKPAYVNLDFIRDFWANGARFPKEAIEAYSKSIVGESARVLNERFNIGGEGVKISGPGIVSQRPILIVTGDSDLRHPREVDGAVARYFGADSLWLADEGIIGNGHMLMIEDNSGEIAALIAAWLERKSL